MFVVPLHTRTSTSASDFARLACAWRASPRRIGAFIRQSDGIHGVTDDNAPFCVEATGECCLGARLFAALELVLLQLPLPSDTIAVIVLRGNACALRCEQKLFKWQSSPRCLRHRHTQCCSHCCLPACWPSLISQTLSALGQQSITSASRCNHPRRQIRAPCRCSNAHASPSRDCS